MDNQHASSVASSSSIPLSSGSRHTRIHFTEGADLFVEPSVKATRTTKSVRRQTLLAALPVDSLPRRRIHSGVDGPSGSMPYSRPRKTFSTVSHQRGIHIANNDSGFDSGPSTLNAFSDEYDLSHEDPQILQDVQRALKLKARREARLKLESNATSQTVTSQPSANSSWSNSSSRPFPTSLTSFPPKTTSHSSEIDFSPSTGTNTRVGLHPVPTSIDDGLTLDWSTPSSEEERSERKWTISVSKRKGKERVAPISSTALEGQENRYAAHLSRIKTIASPQTMRKRAIIADQLERAIQTHNFDLLKVSRWYGSQDVIVRSSLEKAEPFTWLKHLDLRGVKGQIRMPWHLTALIMEEYLQALTRHGRITTIMEDPSSPPTSPNMSPSPYPPSVLPNFPMSSRGSSHSALGPSLTRYTSNEGRVSFEPLIESNRNSLEITSRKSADSIYSSIYPAQPVMIGSPASSKLNVVGSRRKYRERSNDSDDASSAANSASGLSDDNLRKAAVLQKSDQSDRPLGSPRMPHSVKGEWLSPPSAPATPPRQMNIKTLSLDGASNMLSIQKMRSSPMHSRRSSTTNVARLDRLRVKNSIVAPDITSDPDKKRQQEEEDTKMAREYELKSQLLKETVAQNMRIRQLLHRIAAGVKEYDLTQTSLTALLEIPTNGLPPELLEAFSHDPAAITGATRRLQGWRAVDDIHHRIIRQRTLFEDFLAENCHTTGSLISDDVLEDPVNSLRETLKSLRLQKIAVTARANEVAELLSSVHATHQKVKAEYNETLAHTSVVYPELSRIVALEESYKDSYQHFWEIGMDALTLLLDTVTPFWRTYGKTIGEDVQDFLIIPLYRNEFTGEAKRYLITSVPKRSLRHWVLLIVFFYGTIGLVILQGRAAVTSSMHIGLQWIPYDGIRWIALPFVFIGIVIQWCAVIVELAIVLGQIGVLIWWIGWSVKLLS
ncbi:hypothetical protein BDZ89DRAFT_1156684 [Hymenopellis radicata]|nr:hypothetical protein BDZ89DRAFT_1156684 [Hymenopellis radicata]